MNREIGLGIDQSGTGQIEFHKSHESELRGLLAEVGLEMSDPQLRNFGRGTTAVSDVSPTVEPRAGFKEDLVAELTNAGFTVGSM